MRTFIFIKKYNENGKEKKYIAGMVQRKYYPSSLVNCAGSIFYGCDCVEVTEQCHIEL